MGNPTDWLLALALAYERNTAQQPIPPSELFALLPAEAQQRLTSRQQEISAQDDATVTAWLAQTLDGLRQRVRQRSPALDERVHPSHIAAALRHEPLYIQRLLLASLPAAIGTAVARALRQSQMRLNMDDLAPVAPVLNAIRQRFLSQFVSADQIAPLTVFDELTEAELYRVAHAVGVAEVALASYDLPTTEAVTALLRRFAEAEARAIAEQIAALRIRPRPPAAARREFARQLVRTAMTAHKRDPELVTTLGWQVIMVALPAAGDANRLAFAFQKLPPKLVRRLQEWLDAPPSTARPELQKQLFEDVSRWAQHHRNQSMPDLSGAAVALE
ncbi:hypothetical protein [Chloracidobacterium aggregatum]|jgi:hypothetical protein|uniref:DUF2336 domain-containing protein n=1 Tax=Chloracidobacterium sp. N TaxID=2821540 RepID=A0ABX8B2B8_9BACT|nr:hypothetical protein [Chloracidobacterium aggregatum]QUV86206.1 hypothetical protein J8C03_15645 [Chloracidobacterium sp. 2]QUV89348.1 hypothetical protein J8C07_11660 [Chloracidobacterium sp. S]QUV92648.1 hypothetical protein J8C04_12925 [Chloracidobacterium sp. A]QUV95123.1 hypothetical protein J8C05_13950 [Chloracidobacterium sp. N]QUV98333.1 hypothetical protein J8C00_15200 [Chloracidobacterium sp. E]